MKSRIFVLLIVTLVVCSSDVRGMPAPNMMANVAFVSESVSSIKKASVFSTIATAIGHAGTFAWIYTAGRALAKGTFLKPSKKEEYMQSKLQRVLLSPQIAFIATLPTAITCIPSLSPYVSSFVAGAFPSGILVVQGLYDIYKIANWGAKKLNLSWHYKVLDRFWIGIGKHTSERGDDEVGAFVEKLSKEEWPDIELVNEAFSEIDAVADDDLKTELRRQLGECTLKLRTLINKGQEQQQVNGENDV